MTTGTLSTDIYKIVQTPHLKIQPNSEVLLTFQDMSDPAPKPVSMPPDAQFHNRLSVEGKLLGTLKNQVLNLVHVQ
jgi:hypothetical protein